MIRRAGWIVVLLLIALACYHISWYVHETAGFTLHAYDLAEWASLHPAVRSESPALLTSFLLRFPLWVIVAGAALVANELDDPRVRWVLRVGALLLVLRFVPPKEFVTGAGDDPNYRQMALLAIMGVGAVVAALGAARLPVRMQRRLLAAVAVAGIIAGWWGLSRAQELFDSFQIDVQPGAGIAGYSVCMGLVAVMALWQTGPARRALTEAAPAGQLERTVG